jgi:hypothetical protein
MKIHWYQIPILLAINAWLWLTGLFKPKPKPPEPISQWSDTKWAEVMERVSRIETDASINK